MTGNGGSSSNNNRGPLRKLCEKTLPCVRWISNYGQMDAVTDLIAGITIGLVIIPQSIAYVALVGLSAKIGLMSSVIGGLVYSCFGTVKEISIGPTAMMSLLTLQYQRNLPSDNIGLLAFCCGCLGLLFSFINLSVLVEFISVPVSAAFGSCVALIIVSQELRGLLGIQFKSNNFFTNLWKLGENIQQFRLADTILGFSCIILLILLDKLKDIPIRGRHRATLKKLLWCISMSKSAITIFVGCVLTSYFKQTKGTAPFLLTDSVTPGLPEFGFPIFDSQVHNTTISVPMKIRELGNGLVIVPLVALLVHISIAKTFGTVTVGASHELFAISLCNILSSLFNGTVIAGAFTRSAVSSACQVRTPIANIYTMVIAMCALTFLTPYFGLIPKSSLSAVIITAVVICISHEIVIPMWNSSRKDLCVMLISLLSGLWFGIEFGLIIGVLTNFICVIYPWLRPTITIEKHKSECGDFIMVTPDIGLLYLTIDYLRHTMTRQLNSREDLRNVQTIIVNGAKFCSIDFTAVKGLQSIKKDFSNQGKDVLFINLSDKVIETCKNVDNDILNNSLCNSDGYIGYVLNELSTKTNYERADNQPMAMVPLLSNQQKFPENVQKPQTIQHDDNNQSEISKS